MFVNIHSQMNETSKTMKSMIVALIVSCLTFTACVNDAVEDSRPDTLPRDLTASEQKIINSSGSFSYRIFRETAAAEEKENLFISPLSISMALGMTVNGADGETRDAMLETLGMSQMEMKEINGAYQGLIELLANLDPKVQMKIANSIWTRQGFEVQQDFLDAGRQYFDAEIQGLDFSDPAAVETINQWVDSNTEGLIEKIIDGSIPPEMVMYLINAIYFKGNWTQEFDPDKTRDQDFHLEDGSVTTVDMMHREDAIAHYVSDEAIMVDLPYGDSLYTMSLMMPANEETPLDDFIANTLSAEQVSEWHKSLAVSKRELGLPRFSMEYEKTLNDILKDMGMEIAFSESMADFSNINPDKELYISEVKHKTFVEVNEEGTEAAAATSVGVGVTSVGPAPIIFNRPFVFMIRERISGTVLFMGRMKNPSQ